MLNKAEYASLQISVSSYFHNWQKFTAEMKRLSALRISSSVELIIIPLLDPKKISNQFKTLEFHPVDTSFHSSDEGFFCPALVSLSTMSSYIISWNTKIKWEIWAPWFKLNVLAFRPFIKGTGSKFNKKHWRSQRERSRGTDVAQNTAQVFAIRTTEMKIIINQMHFLKHQDNACRYT